MICVHFLSAHNELYTFQKEGKKHAGQISFLKHNFTYLGLESLNPAWFLNFC